jgi:transposase
VSLAELVIVSVKVEGRTKDYVARDYKVSRYWVQQLVKPYKAEGQAAFVPRSRRPHTNSSGSRRGVVRVPTALRRARADRACRVHRLGGLAQCPNSRDTR